MRGNETEESQAYITLKNLFDQTRKVYSRETPFIDAIAIQMFQPSESHSAFHHCHRMIYLSGRLGAHAPLCAAAARSFRMTETRAKDAIL